MHIAPNAHEHINTKGVITIDVSPHRDRLLDAVMVHGCSSHDAWGRSLGPRSNTIILRDSHPIWLPLETPAHYGI